MSDYKRHLPPDASLAALHVAFNRLWDAVEGGAGVAGVAPARAPILGSSPTYVASGSTPSVFLGVYTDATLIGNGTSASELKISPYYPGQTSIVTLGAITTGTWNGSIISVVYGGTGANLSATGGVSRVIMQETLGGPATVRRLTASDVSNTPTGTISSTDVQAALNELDTEKLAIVTHDYTLSGDGTVASPLTIPPYLSFGALTKPSYTDNLDGTVTIGSDGIYCLATLPSGECIPKQYSITGGVFTPTNGATSYLVADYNGGTPVLSVITNVALINETTVIPVHTFYREGTEIHQIDWDELGVALMNKIHQSIVKTQRFRRQDGLLLAEAATRLVTVTSGTTWVGAVPVVCAAFNSSTDTLRLYAHVGGVWTESSITQYNNSQYDDGTNLAALSGASKYAVNFVYRVISGNEKLCYILLGQGDYKLIDAQNAQPPLNVPAEIAAICQLVGRIIVANGASTATQIDSAFTTRYGGVASVNFTDITGTCAPTQGGTGLTTYTLGDMLYAPSANALATLAGNTSATMAVLTQTGTGTASAVPVWTSTTGTGDIVRATSPTLVTPTLGAASATSINKVAITAPATSATLTIADGKTFTASNSLTFSGTDGSTLNIGTGGTLGTAAYVADSTMVHQTGNELSIAGRKGFTDTTASTSTITGAIVVAGGIGAGGAVNAAVGLSVTAAAGAYKGLTLLTAGVNRWYISSNNTAESGADAGSNFSIRAYDDAGAQIDIPVSIIRAAGGLLTLARPTSFSNTTAATSETSGSVINSGGYSANVASTATASSTNAGAWFTVTGNPASASSGNFFGVRGVGQISSLCSQAISGSAIGGYFNGTHAGSGTLAGLRGVSGIATVGASGGIVSAIYGGYNEATVSATAVQTFPLIRTLFAVGTINSPSGATVTQWNGVECQFTLTAATAVGTLRGFYLSGITATGVGSTTTIVGVDLGAINAASTTPATNAYTIRTGNVTGATNNWQLNLGTGISKFNDTTDSTSTSTGSFQTLGGAAIAKALWVGGLANIAGVATLANTTDASTLGTAGTVVLGGASVAKKLFIGDVLVVPKTSGMGIKVDTTTPTYPWRDQLGTLMPDPGGANSPTLAIVRGGVVRNYFYSVNDKMDFVFHIPHDYAPGTDVYIHIHWTHNGTAISGTLTVTLATTYAKGHNQAAFPAEKTVTVTYATVNIATTPQYQHRIDEVQWSSAGGSATLFDTALIEPDGMVLGTMTATGIPTITGGTTNEPCIFQVDLHYQSTGIGTKQKAPNFYV